jgi:hypothetical protein
MQTVCGFNCLISRKAETIFYFGVSDEKKPAEAGYQIMRLR